jgi:hypothetical protein
MGFSFHRVEETGTAIKKTDGLDKHMSSVLWTRVNIPVVFFFFWHLLHFRFRFFSCFRDQTTLKSIGRRRGEAWDSKGLVRMHYYTTSSKISWPNVGYFWTGIYAC